MKDSLDANAAHRLTAGDWHGGQSSPLYAYASTGAITVGLVTEIQECIDIVEHSDVSADTDVVEEHERLSALLDEVRPEAARQKARAIGHAHAQDAASWWQQDAIGGRSTGDTAEVARRVLRGIEEGDPAVLDALPRQSSALPDGYTPDDLAEDCPGPEPDLDDTPAHRLWHEAQPGLREAYEDGFKEAVESAVADACPRRIGRLFEPPSPGPRRALPARPGDGLCL